MSNAKLRNGRLLAQLSSDQPKVEVEDLQWVLLRLSSLPALPHAERSQQGGNSRRVSDGRYCGYIHGGPRLLHLYRPLILEPELNAGQGLYLPGPLQDLPDNAIVRSKLYLNLVAYLDGATAKEFPKLFLWLPARYQMEAEIEMLTELWFAKSKHGMPAWKRNHLLNTPWQEQGLRMFEVQYNDERVRGVIDFLQKNPRFGVTKLGYVSRQITHESAQEPLHQPRAAREPFLTG